MQSPEDDSPVESQTVAGPSTQPEVVSHTPSAPQVDTFWKFDFVVFQVENTLFCVHKQGFLVPGGPFEAMFSAPPEDPTNVDGASANNPIVLHGTTADDFRAFLRALPFENPITSYDEWVGVLRLAHRWNYVKIREQAITSLTPLLASKTAEKIHLGNEFLVQDWLRHGLLDLVRDQTLEPDELAEPPFLLDWKTIAKICRIKEKTVNNNISEYKTYCNTCKKYYGLDYGTLTCSGKCRKIGGSVKQEKLVEDYFSAELAGAFFIKEDDHDNAPALPTDIQASNSPLIPVNLGAAQGSTPKKKKKARVADS